MTEYKKHSPADLIARRARVNMDELEVRMKADKRKPSNVCELFEPEAPTPCWWPFCNCGER